MRILWFALLLALPLSCSRQGDVISSPGDPASIAALPGTGSSSPTTPPSVAFVNLEQLEAELSKARGHGVLLNFWAMWCAPCVAELPELVETAHAFKDRGGTVLLVSYDMMIPDVTRDGVTSQMNAFVTRRKIDVPVLIYEGVDYDAINARFELPGEVPVTLAIDRRGKIVDRQEGRTDKRRMAEMMERALAP